MQSIVADIREEAQELRDWESLYSLRQEYTSLRERLREEMREHGFSN